MSETWFDNTRTVLSVVWVGYALSRLTHWLGEVTVVGTGVWVALTFAGLLGLVVYAERGKAKPTPPKPPSVRTARHS